MAGVVDEPASFHHCKFRAAAKGMLRCGSFPFIALAIQH